MDDLSLGRKMEEASISWQLLQHQLSQIHQQSLIHCKEVASWETDFTLQIKVCLYQEHEQMEGDQH
jgi:hypothetical protein